MKKIRDAKSIIIVLIYAGVNIFILGLGLTLKPESDKIQNTVKSLAPEFTEVSQLEYFHLKNSIPQMSVSAKTMRSEGEKFADFESPRGVYNYQKKNKTIKYSAEEGTYQKKNEKLSLTGNVELSSEEAHYTAMYMEYYLNKDLVIANRKVSFEGEDPKTRDNMIIRSDTMRANPEAQLSHFKGNVDGEFQRKKKYEGKTYFSSSELILDGNKSHANLNENVRIKRNSYDITAGKADIYLENYNKSLKYFVLNDDVKVKEKVQTKDGPLERRAFAERLEGFAMEQKMILSGAPKIEMGKDVIKGYRITIRENADLVEVDDAMSDMEVKRKKARKD